MASLDSQTTTTCTDDPTLAPVALKLKGRIFDNTLYVMVRAELKDCADERNGYVTKLDSDGPQELRVAEVVALRS